LSGRGLCDELITRPEESYRLCCVVVCDLETSRMGAPYTYDISRLRVKTVRHRSVFFSETSDISGFLTSILFFLRSYLKANVYTNNPHSRNNLKQTIQYYMLMFVNPCVIVRFIKKKIQQDATTYQNFIIPYLYEAQHVSGNTPPIFRSLKLHWPTLVFRTWKVVGRIVGRHCQAQYTVPDNPHQLHAQQPSTYEKPEAASASFRLLMMGGVSLETCWASYKYEMIKFWYIVASCWIIYLWTICWILQQQLWIVFPVT